MATKARKPAAAAKVAAVSNPDGSYLDAGPVLGGGIIAVAVSLVLVQFGSAIGLTTAETTLSNGNPSWDVLVVGLWAALMAIASAAAGGYVAGRMRRPWSGTTADEIEFRDGVHGLVVWGLATIIAGLALAFIGLLGAAGAAAGGTETAQLTGRAADIAANISIILAFSTAAGAALGAAAAWFAAVLGGQHRNENIAVHTLVPAMFRRST